MRKSLCMAVMGILLAFGGAALAAQNGQLSLEERVRVLEEKLSLLEKEKQDRQSTFTQRFQVGGYGEIHANFQQGGEEDGDSGDKIDFHRLVLYLGYSFADWIKFHSEVELEHAMVEGGEESGEVELEQGYVDFLLNPTLNFRVGRILAPLGIINKKHEPPAFYGVERPFVETYIIPTTWPVDGAGIFGSPVEGLAYELYLTTGLKGEKIDPLKGLKGAKQTERPSLNALGVTGRLDFYPLLYAQLPGIEHLRLGLSFYYGGLDNGNDGEDPENLDGELGLYSADFELTSGPVDLKGVLAWAKIDQARDLALSTGKSIPEEMLGYYLEGGLHLLPQSLKKGKLSRADLVLFARYEYYNTQEEMPSGIVADSRGDRRAWTFGLSFYPVPNLVIKADFQSLRDEAPGDPEDRFNLGIGWQF